VEVTETGRVDTVLMYPAYMYVVFGMTLSDINSVHFASQPATQGPAGRTRILPDKLGHENLDQFHLCLKDCERVKLTKSR